MEGTDGKAALREVQYKRIRNEHPDRSHLLSLPSTYEYTDVYGEGFETVAERGKAAAEALDGEESRSKEGGLVAEAEDTVVGGQPATAFCICPVECVGQACNDCSKKAPTSAQSGRLPISQAESNFYCY